MLKIHILATVHIAALLSISSVQAVTLSEEAVIVTATRTAVTADESLASVSIITQDDIVRSEARSVPELLRGMAGIDLTIQGGYGKLTNTFVRGTNAGHVLVLVDGIKIGSATAGTPAWEFLPVAEIERIEIVRGVRSSLYGSEAIGGVIQIFTRRVRGPMKPHAVMGVGSDHTNEVGAGISGEAKNIWYSLSTSRFATRGFSAREPVPGLNEPDLDGYRNHSVSARLGQRLGSSTEWELHGLQARGNTEFDSTDNNEDNFLQQAFGARLQLRPTTSWGSGLRLGHSRDDRRSIRPDGAPTFAGPTRFETVRRTLTWHNDVTVHENQTFSFGYDFMEDQVRSTTSYARTTRDNTAVYLQHQAGFGPGNLLLGLRRDDNEQFGNQHTGNISYGHTLREHLRIVASHGTGFRAPTFNDLYFPGFSNPNLRPEHSRNTEVGLKNSDGRVTWSLFAFHTRIRDLIVFDQASSQPQNVETAVIDGVEAEGSVKRDDWRIAGTLTYLDPRDEATDRILPRRSKRSARISLDQRIGDTEIGASILAQGSRYDNKTNTVRLGGYGILNFHAHRRLSRDWNLGLRVENVFDKKYQTIATYPSPGRGVFFTARYSPKER